VIYDRANRSNFGPVVQALDTSGAVDAEINHRRVRVCGAVTVGISISSDGNLFCTPANFLRLFPDRNPGAIDIGLVGLRAGEDAKQTARELQPLLGEEAVLLTRQELIDAELNNVRTNAPIDFIFGLGVGVGFFIGVVVVYQILYTEVTNHLPQLATLKAMGFTDGYLLRLVVWQGLFLAVLGYLPGFVLALGLYDIAEEQVQMAFSMTPERTVGVALSTAVMCCIAGAIAVRKAWQADPAEVF
jgi:putative ABC transport system permease protein